MKKIFINDLNSKCAVFTMNDPFLIGSIIWSWTTEGQPFLYGVLFQDKMELALLFTLPLTHEE